MDILYNGVRLQLIKTNSVGRVARYSNDGVDYLYDEVTIDINYVYNPQATTIVQGVPSLPIETDVALRSLLMRPRGRLLFANIGPPVPEILYASPEDGVADPTAPTTAPDANNGPLPQSLTIHRVEGVKTFFGRYIIKTWLQECEGDEFGILSNRYSQSLGVDERFYETRVTEGEAVFRTDALAFLQRQPDDFRQVLLPVCPAGFQRARIEIGAASAGNRLQYRVTDREKAFDLGETDPRQGGSGIVDIEATYGVSTIADPNTGVASPMALATVDAVVKGSKIASTWRMTQVAFLLAGQKLPLGNPQVGILMGSAINQSMTDRIVRLHLAYRMNPAPNGAVPPFVQNALQTDQVFAPQGGVNPSPPNQNGTAGTADLRLIAQSLQVACVNYHNDALDGPEVSEPFSPGAPGANPVPDVVISPGDILPPNSPQYDPSTFFNPYTTYKAEVLYEKNFRTIQAPVTGGLGSSGDTTTGSTGAFAIPTPPTPTAVFLVLANPTTTKVVQWTGERINQYPAVPNPVPISANLILLRANIQPAASELLPDGQSLVCRVSGRYEYGLRVPYGPGDELAAAALPWMSVPLSENAITFNDYADGIIDDGAGDGGGQGATGGTVGLNG